MKESNVPTDRDKFINQLKEIFRLLKERKVLTDRDKANNQQNLFQGGALLAISVILLQGIISMPSRMLCKGMQEASRHG